MAPDERDPSPAQRRADPAAAHRSADPAASHPPADLGAGTCDHAGAPGGGRGEAVRRAVLAWQMAMAGRDGEVPVQVLAAASLARSLPRRDRHAVTILTLAAEGHTSRAAGLAAEHLRDFPDDELVAGVARHLATEAR